MSFCLSPFTLPGGAPASKKGGALPPLPPPPVRRHDVPCEAGTPWRGAARRFTAEDSGNPCQRASNAGFPAQPGPQRRGLRPLIVQICNCQNRAPPMCATPPFVRWPPIRRHGLDPREAEIVDHVAAVGGRVFLLSLVDLLHDDTEAVMAFDGVLTPESASFAGQAGLSHSLAYQNTPKRRLHRFPSQGAQVPPPVGKPEWSAPTVNLSTEGLWGVVAIRSRPTVPPPAPLSHGAPPCRARRGQRGRRRTA